MNEQEAKALEQAIANVELELGPTAPETLEIVILAIENNWTTKEFIMQVKGA